MEAGLRRHDLVERVDVIVSWPRNCDYPLWRRFLRDERSRFGRVLVVFTDHAGDDISGFVRAHLEADCLDSRSVSGDWRDTAVNQALDHSTSERVWFTEQDFLIGEGFWEQVDGSPAIGWQEHDDRWHPSCLFVNRDLIERTSRYFGTEPVDHFYRFGKELEALTPIKRLVGGFEHLQGTSQNHWLIDSNVDEGVFKRERFRRYLRDCLDAGVPLHPEWAARARIEGSAHP